MHAARVPSGRRAVFVAALLVAVVVGLTFAHAAGFAFLRWDDDNLITGNPHLRALDGASLAWMWTDVERSVRWTPLSWLNWSVLYAVFGLNARAFHAQGVLVHAVNAALVLLVARRVLVLHGARTSRDDATTLAAAAAALLWALHPMRVEVVAWASQVRFGIATGLALCAVLLHLRVVVDHHDARAPWRRLWPAIALSSASCFVYGSTVPLVGVLLILDVFVVRRRAGWRALIVEKLPYCAAPAVVAVMTIVARARAPAGHLAAATLDEFGIVARAMQAAYALAWIALSPLRPAWPRPLDPVLVDAQPFDAPLVVALIVVAVITVAAISVARARPGLAAAWAAIVVLSLPVLGFSEHPYFPADRYAYAPHVVIAVLAAAALQRLAALSRVVVVLAIAAALASGAAARVQTLVWRDTESLFRAMSADVADHWYRAEIALRLGDLLMEQGRAKEAAEQYRVTLSVAPDAERARAGLARAEAAARE